MSRLPTAARAVTPRAGRARHDLRSAQVPTPLPIVRFFWSTLRQHRPHLRTVLDMGAGDGRFARYGAYTKYLGVEIDAAKLTTKHPATNATVVPGCVFALPATGFAACVGNPPYLRHQDIEAPWKKKTVSGLSRELGIQMDSRCNLFLYFVALAVLRTDTEGIIALIVPFDWVSRPAARNIRGLIKRERWDVNVYRFSFPVFPGVRTTASMTVIDKRGKSGEWNFYDVDRAFQVTARRGETGTGRALLPYATRTTLYARRGISPGNQNVFTLTEGERIHHGLTKRDVQPCVTTLRGVSRTLDVLDAKTFKNQFVDAGRRCWLVRSRGRLSDRLRRYLGSVPASLRATATCRRQDPWYNYESPEIPALLVHSGFVSLGPRVVRNDIGAAPVGSMYGVYGCAPGARNTVAAAIANANAANRVVPHSGRLRKIEVGQLNGILTKLEISG